MLVKKQVREQRKEHQIRLSQRVAHVEGLEDIHVNPHGEKKKRLGRNVALEHNAGRRAVRSTMTRNETNRIQWPTRRHTHKNKNNKMNSAKSGEVLVRAAQSAS